MNEVKAELEPVGCPLCKKNVVEIGPETTVNCVCPCGAFLLIIRDSRGEIVRNERWRPEALDG